MSKHREQIIEAARGKVDEELLGATFAKPRGSTTAVAGGGVIAGEIKAVQEVLSVVPLAEVDSFEVKRMGTAGVMEITAGGSSFKLEGKVPDMRELAETFKRAKATV